VSGRRSSAWILSAALCALLSGCAHRYAAKGVVVGTAPDRRQITVSHEAIQGYMDAMVMPFSVRDIGLLAGIAPGDRIAFRLVVSRAESFIDRVTVVSAPRPDAGLLRTPVQRVLVPIGGAMPDFSLIDQSGRRITLSALRGQVVLLTFIYTRCPLPDYCPRLMINFAELKKQFADRLGRTVTLLTITFDPKYDTSDVLARYGSSFGADGQGWHLLTGTPDAIQTVTEAFGIEFWPDEGLLTHTLQTAVIDPQGRLYAAVEGKDFSTRQLVDLVSAALLSAGR
jgi:protein SCO1/2